MRPASVDAVDAGRIKVPREGVWVPWNNGPLQGLFRGSLT